MCHRLYDEALDTIAEMGRVVAAAIQAHIASCPDCRRELESLHPVVDRFVYWPTDVLRSPTPLVDRLALADEVGARVAHAPTLKRLIAAVAVRSGATLLHRDQDFEVIARHTPLRVEG